MRTDLTTLCLRCVARIPKTKRCPRCGTKKLVDLTSPEARRIALLRLGARPLGTSRMGTLLERGLINYVRYGALGVSALAFMLALVSTGSMDVAVMVAILAFIAQAVLGGACFAVFGLYILFTSVLRMLLARSPKSARAATARTSELPRILVAEPLTLPSPNRDRFVGQVRVASPIHSLLRHEPCAAFRLSGEGPLGTIDDAGGADFEIVSHDGVARVMLGEASFDLPLDRSPVTVRPDEALRAFLEQRGVFPERGPVRLAEATLCEGDWVEVEGRSRAVTEADGYRGTTQVRRFEESPGSPLYIRKIVPPDPG